MSPSKKVPAKTKSAAKKAVKPASAAAKKTEAKKTAAKKAPAKKAAAKKAAPEVYPGETAPERVIKADLKVVKGERSDIWRDCVGAGRIGEGLRDTWRKQLAKCKKELGFRYLRAHGLFHDEMRVYGEDKAGNLYSDSVELKMTCIDGVLKYLRDKKFGYADVTITNREPNLPYILTGFTHTGKEIAMIHGGKGIRNGVLSRNMDDLALTLYLKDDRGTLRHEFVIIAL